MKITQGKKKARESFCDQTFQLCMDVSEAQLGPSQMVLASFRNTLNSSRDRLSENLEYDRKVICKPLLGVLKLTTLAPRFLLC